MDSSETPALESAAAAEAAARAGVVATAADPPEERIPTRNIFVYAAPMIGVMVSNVLVGLYLMKFATDVLLIPPAAVGVVSLAGRVWDAVSDPMAGHLSDRTRTRMGRRRPWFLAAAFPIGVSVIALWAPPPDLAGGALVAWFAASVLFFYTAFTAFRVPHLAMGAELSRGYHDRTRVFAILQFVESLGIVGATGALYFFERAENPRLFAAEFATGLALVTTALVLVAAFVLRERAEFQGRGARSVGSMLRDVGGNAHARILMTVYLLEQFGFTALASLLPYVSDYVLKTPGYTSYYVIAAVAPMIVSLPAWVVISRRFGKKPAWLFSIAVKALVFGAMLLLDEGDVAAILALCIGFGLMNGCSAVVTPSLQADVVDWDESRTGERKEGAYFAMFNFAHKAAAGLSMGLTGITLSLVGFQPNVEQTETAVLGIRLLAAGFPCLFYAVSLVLVARFALDENAHRALRSKLGGGDRAGA
jgi:GPH family glycoside/pentoside/hexuronide:cation symporter